MYTRLRGKVEVLYAARTLILILTIQGNTALHVAYRKSSRDVIDLLLNSPQGKTLENTRNYVSSIAMVFITY